MHVTAIILAAGESRRMGTPKQNLPFGGTTMLRAVVDQLLRPAVAEVVVVLGHHREQVEPTLAGTGVQIALNPTPDDGMLSSIQCAIAEVGGTADAWLVALGDQPSISPDVIDALIRAAERSGKGLFEPTWAGRSGHPVLVLTSYRDEILAMPRTIGLNALFAAHRDDIVEVPVQSDGVLTDIDTPEEYERALAGRSATPPARTSPEST